MKLVIANTWDEYELLDSGDGLRLERFGEYRLVRPDPQILWHKQLPPQEWEKADAVFHKNEWDKKTSLPNTWKVRYKNLSLLLQLTSFKHTGVFPEQTKQWEWIEERIKRRKNNPSILNLFAYTGGATLAAASCGARVTHVDASKPTITWARTNQEASQLSHAPIRWIFDDCIQFVKREVKRQVQYDGIIMDPPVYGHGKHGQRWDFMKDFPQLLTLCKKLLSPQPLCMVVNAYAISASALMLDNVMKDFTNSLGGTIESGELALQETTNAKRLLSTGIYTRWAKE